MFLKVFLVILFIPLVNCCGRGNPTGYGHTHSEPCTVYITTGGNDNKEPEACSKRTGLNEEEKRTCAIQDGTAQLLKQRNDEWGWGERVEAEAILALHLANDTLMSRSDPYTYISVKQMIIDLLSAINNDELKSDAWGRGKLSHYVLALEAICKNSSDFYGHNLLEMLQKHLINSSQYFQSNKFSYALVMLALCTSNVSLDENYLQKVSETPGTYTFGVDEASMVYQAFQCIQNPQYMTQSQAALDFILSQQDDKGLFGNEFSTALAVQAIFASKNESLFEKTQAGVDFMVKAVDRLQSPSANLLLSVLPAIATKTYLDVRGTRCIFPKTNITTTITTYITVINDITKNFNETWMTQVKQGATLFAAMQMLQDADSTFSFSSISTTFGQMITTLCGMDFRRSSPVLANTGCK